MVNNHNIGSSQNIPYENEGVTTNYHINQPITFKWGITESENIYEENQFLTSDTIHLALKIYRNNLDSESTATAIANQSISLKNAATGESETFTTDENGTIDFGQMTYDEFMSRSDYEIQTQFSTAGEYSLEFTAKTDRIGYQDEFETWYVSDYVNKWLKVNN